MRIGINGFFLKHPYTGSGAYLRQLLQALSALPELELCLYAPTDTEKPDWLAQLPSVQLKHLAMRAPGNWGKLLFEMYAFPQQALSDGCDVIHTPYFAPPLTGCDKAVVTIHDIIGLLLPGYSGGILGRAYNLVTRVAARRTRHLLTDSLWSKREVIQLLSVPAEHVSIAYLAAGDNCKPVIDPAILADVKACYRLPEQFVLYFGGYDRRKGVDTLLRAYQSLSSQLEKVPPLVLAGKFPECSNATLKDPRPLIIDLGLQDKVIGIGLVREEDKPAVFSLAESFVFSSVYEGFGLTPLEAMACGTPVVAMRAPAVSEVCADAALLARPNDANDLARTMAQAIGNEKLRCELRRRGLIRASDFSWQKTANITAQAYYKVSTSAGG